MMSLIFSVLQLVIRRSRANWRLLSSIVAGVVVAVALLSSTPFYSNALNDLGLSHALRQRPIELLDVQIYAPNYPLNSRDYSETWELIDQQVSKNIGPLLRQEERWIQSQTYYAGWADRPIPTGSDRPRGHFHVFTNLEEHVTFAEGRFPEPLPSGLSTEELADPGLEIEAMIGSEAAERFSVGAGDRLIFLWGYGQSQRQVTIKLTGVIDPINPRDEYWFLNTEIFSGPDDNWMTAPLFIPEQTLFEGISRIFPRSNATYNWFYYVDLTKINSQNAEAIGNRVNRLEHQIMAELPRSSQFSVLDSVIADYQRKLLFTQIPLFLLMFEIVAIILYYLVTVANMVIERQSGEIALLRSRGASTGQIMGIFFAEGLMISALGGAIGPFLGALVFSLLGKTAPFFPLTGGGLLPIRFSASVFILAAGGALLCLLALLVPAIQASRRGVVHQRQLIARPPRTPFWQRYYIDLILLVFSAALFWQLNQRGTIVSLDIFGGLDIDPLLLMTPILVIVGIAIIFLRLFPIIMNLASRLARYVTNASAVLSTQYMARNPIHYGRLILLLMMAASVGMFSASVLGTLQRSYNERAMYSVGSDIRLEGVYGSRLGKTALADSYSDIPGVEDVSVAYRGSGVVGALFSQVDFTIFAIDPESFQRVAWYRDDFSEKSLPELTALLAMDQPVGEGLNLPYDTESLGIWVRPIEQGPELRIFAKIKDGNGRYTDYELGSITSNEWQYLEINLTDTGTYPVSNPSSTLHSIYARLGGSEFQEPPRGVYFDDLQAQVAFSTEPVVIEDFEDVRDWTVISQDASGQASRTTDSFTINTKVVHSGTASGEFTWRARRSFGRRGIYPNINTRSLTVLASRSFLREAAVSVGSRVEISMSGQSLSAQIQGVVDYFPTLDPRDKSFLITNFDRISSMRNLGFSRGGYLYPNEVWLTITDDETQRQNVLDTLYTGQFRTEQIYDRDESIAGAKADPLAAAGWGGILLIAFLGVVLICGLGFVVYAYLSAQGRQLEFAILRTLGFSLRQIIGLVCFEQFFIIVVGMGIGTLIGVRIGSMMMPFLQITETGEMVLPPFILTIDWLTIGWAYIILTVAFIITISMVILFFSRVAIHQTLRTGEM